MKKTAFLLATMFLGICGARSQTNYSDLVMSTPNLLGYWRFSSDMPTNSSFGTNTSTFSGDAHVGPAGSGPALTNTPNNTAVLLDGNGDFVTTTLAGGLTNNQGSMIAWFKLDKLPSVAGRFFFIAGESQVANDFDVQIETDNKIKFYTDGGSSTVDTNVMTSADTNVWHFVAVTFTASTSRKIYLDGALVASSTPGGHNPSGTGTFAIGDSHVFGGRFFQGAIDEVAIFNRELTGAEVTNLYFGYSSVPVFTPFCTNITVTLSAGSNSCVAVTNDVTITNGLVAWYKADGNADDSYGTNNGTLEGGAAFTSSQSGQAFQIQPAPASQDVNIGNLSGLDNATGFTVSAYVKFLPTTNGNFYIFSQGLFLGGFPIPPYNPANCGVIAGSAVAGVMDLFENTNTIGFSLPLTTVTNVVVACSNNPGIIYVTNVNYGTNYSPLQLSATMPTNSWTHLAATWRSSDGLWVLYSNGVPVKSVNYGAGFVFPAFRSNSPPPGSIARWGPALIGAANVGVTGFDSPITLYSGSGGNVDNLRLYARALSAAEIQQIMQADSGATVTNCDTSDAITTNLDFCTVPPGRLQILNAPPGNVQLFWPSQTNAFYLLQGSDEVSPLDWTTVWGAEAGNGSNVIVPDSTTSRPRRFYRLLSTEP